MNGADSSGPPLELHHDPAVARGVMYAQYVGWAMLTLIIGGAILGFAGSGPASQAVAQAEGIHIRYSRFGRMSSPTELEIVLRQGRELRISREYLAKFEAPRFVPEPQSAALSGDTLVWQFSGPPDVPLEVRVQMTVAEGSVGVLHAAVGNDRSTVTFWQFMWP
jgi:hypothetical protein